MSFVLPIQGSHVRVELLLFTLIKEFAKTDAATVKMQKEVFASKDLNKEFNKYLEASTGIKKEAHAPVVYDKLSPTNLIMLDLDTEKVISFGNAYLDGNLYSMEQFLSMGSPKANNFRSYNYYVNKDSLNDPNSIKIDKLMHTETTKLPEINFTCEKINY